MYHLHNAPGKLLLRPFDKIDMTLGHGQWPRINRKNGWIKPAFLLGKSVCDSCVVLRDFTALSMSEQKCEVLVAFWNHFVPLTVHARLLNFLFKDFPSYMCTERNSFWFRLSFCFFFWQEQYSFFPKIIWFWMVFMQRDNLHNAKPRWSLISKWNDLVSFQKITKQLKYHCYPCKYSTWVALLMLYGVFGNVIPQAL